MKIILLSLLFLTQYAHAETKASLIKELENSNKNFKEQISTLQSKMPGINLSETLSKHSSYISKSKTIINSFSENDLKLLNKQREIQKRSQPEGHQAQTEKIIKLAMEGKTLYKPAEVKEAIDFDNQTFHYIDMYRTSLKPLITTRQTLSKAMLDTKSLKSFDSNLLETVSTQLVTYTYKMTPKEDRKIMLEISKNKKIKEYINHTAKGTNSVTESMMNAINAYTAKMLEALPKN